MLTALSWTTPPDGSALAVLDTVTVDGKERQNVAAYQGGAWTVTVANASFAVTGPLTDAQLRASAVAVSGPATNAELRASPLPVVAPVVTAGSVTQFTSEISAQVLAADANRTGVTIQNRGDGTLLLLFGTGTVTASNSTVQLEAGDFFRVSREFAGLAIHGLFLEAGTANVQVFS